MKLSLVIPVYNTPPEAFSRCLRSVLDQDFSDFEVLVADDGSKDSLSLQYEACCRKDSRIRYEKISNGGVSRARNRGIAQAQGDYIAFLDADDTLQPGFFSEAVSLALTHGAEAVIGRIRHCPDQPLEQFIPELTVEQEPRKVLEYLFFTDENPPLRVIGSSCGRIYRTSRVKEHPFDEALSYSEDQVFNRVFFSCAEGPVVLAPRDWYLYYQNDYSAIHAYRKWDEIDSRIRYWDRLAELNRREENRDLIRRYDKLMLNSFYLTVYEGLLAGETYNRIRLKSLLELPALASLRTELKAEDFLSIVSRMKFLFFRCRNTAAIYLISRLFRFLNRSREKTA